MMPWRPTISIANTSNDYSLSKQVFKKKLIEIHVFHTDNITYIYTTNDLSDVLYPKNKRWMGLTYFAIQQRVSR